MSIIAYPLEATEYTAEDVQSYLSTRTSGVYSEDITFTPEGMTVTISPFLAWFNYAKFKGCSVAVTEPETLTFSPAHAVLDRIDRIALRVDFTVNKPYFTVIEGTPSSSPVPNDISKTEAINDISPVYVRIRAGATEITPADITSTILDENVCGIMRDGVTGIPTAQLQAQSLAQTAQLKSEAEQLISRLHDAIDSVQNNSAFMIGDVYDPEKYAKPVAFKDDVDLVDIYDDFFESKEGFGWIGQIKKQGNVISGNILGAGIPSAGKRLFTINRKYVAAADFACVGYAGDSSDRTATFTAFSTNIPTSVDVVDGNDIDGIVSLYFTYICK